MKVRRYSPTERRQRIRKFAAQMVKCDYNATEAIMRCGFTDNRASAAEMGKHMRRTEEYLEEIEKIADKLEEKDVASLAEKRALLWATAQAASAKVEIYDKDGNVTTTRIENPSAVASLIGELNKMDGDLAAIKLNAKVDSKQKVTIRKNYTGAKPQEDEAEE